MPLYTNKMDKPALRRLVARRLADMSPPTRAAADAALCRRGDDWTRSRIRPGDLVLAYAPLPDEPDLRPLFSAWRERGLRLAFPCLAVKHAADADRPAGESAASIRGGGAGEDDEVAAFFEPEDGCAPESCLPRATRGLDDAVAFALILVPGRAFSPSGCRVGRGGGWYDRWLARHANAAAPRLALAYDEQIFPQVPTEAHDLPVDALITPTRAWPDEYKSVPQA